MVADDWPEVQAMLIRCLETWGFTVLSAKNGADLVQQSIASLPDLILMDLQMPVMNGYEATLRIRSTPETKHIPIIIFSADAGSELGEKARAAGCNECIQKPANIETLRNAIEHHLAHCSS